MCQLTYTEPAFTKRFRWTRTHKPQNDSVYERAGTLLGHEVAFRVHTNPRGALGASSNTHVTAWVDGQRVHDHHAPTGGLKGGAESACNIIRERVALSDCCSDA